MKQIITQLKIKVEAKIQEAKELWVGHEDLMESMINPKKEEIVKSLNLHKLIITDWKNTVPNKRHVAYHHLAIHYSRELTINKIKILP